VTATCWLAQTTGTNTNAFVTSQKFNRGKVRLQISDCRTQCVKKAWMPVMRSSFLLAKMATCKQDSTWILGHPQDPRSFNTDMYHNFQMNHVTHHLNFIESEILISVWILFHNVVYKAPEGKKSRVKFEEWRGQGIGPLFLSKDQETSCSEKHEHDRRNEEVHHLTRKLLPQGHDAKQCSPS
jgi:hypothetical protein